MKARETKVSRTSDVGTSGTTASAESTDEETSLVQLAEMTEDAIDTDDEAVDPSFDMNESIKSDTDHVFKTFCEDWVCQLGRDDKVSLGLFLSFQLTQYFELGATKAAELAGLMIGKSDKTDRGWRSYFFENG